MLVALPPVSYTHLDVYKRQGLAYSVGGVVLSHAVVALPYCVAIMVDVTHAAGTRLEDAARTLGAGRLRTLLHLSLIHISARASTRTARR